MSDYPIKSGRCERLPWTNASEAIIGITIACQRGKMAAFTEALEKVYTNINDTNNDDNNYYLHQGNNKKGYHEICLNFDQCDSLC